jgi:hypothetical protein
MKYAPLILGLALGLTSCQQPSSSNMNGMASLFVHVRAEPKTGAGPSPQKVNVYDAPKTTDRGAFTQIDYFDLDNIVVWLERTSGTTPAPAAAVTIDIDPAKTSSSLEDVVTVGQQLVLRNAGTSPQTIYSVSDGNDFDFEAVPANGEARYTVRSPGLIEILTGSSMDYPVKIYAAPSPWVRLAHSGQTVAFKDLEPGQYRLYSWHPRLPGSQTDVTLIADHTSDASIDVSVNSLPKVTVGSGG